MSGREQRWMGRKINVRKGRDMNGRKTRKMNGKEVNKHQEGKGDEREGR